MAKLNWQKLHIQQQANKGNHQANKAEWQKRHKDTWLVGKHYGKKLKQLPLEYLIWVSETFKESSIHKSKADEELRKRYRQLKSDT